MVALSIGGRRLSWGKMRDTVITKSLIRAWRVTKHHWLVTTISVAAIILGWLAYSSWEIVQGVREARLGISEIDTAKSLGKGNGIEDERPLASLTKAQIDFSQASNHLNWPLLVPLHFVPVLGRQLESISDLSTAAHVVTVVARKDVIVLHRLLPRARQLGSDRVAAIAQIGTLSSSSYQQLSELNLGPTDALFSSLAKKHNEFANDLESLQTTLARVGAAASAGAQLLDGPSKYVILAANNAQMHAGSGAFLEVGSLTAAHGSINVGSFATSASISVPAGAVPLSGDLAQNWAFLKPNQEFENLALTPQFDVTASLAARMWTAATGTHVDGVMSIDMVAVKDLLSATGSVSVNGLTLTSANALQYLMHDQYLGITGSAAQVQRRDELGAIASATVQALEHRQVSLTALATALSQATSGRHLMLWSSSPKIEQAWQTVGAAGVLEANDLVTAVINRGGNKLDQYLHITNTLKLTPSSRSTRAVLRITLHNETPLGEPQYIGGPYPGIGTIYGEYRGYVTVNLPGDASHAIVKGYRSLVAAGQEGPTLLLAPEVDLLRNQVRSVTITFTLPETSGEIDIPSSARVPSISWTVGTDHFLDSSTHAVNW